MTRGVVPLGRRLRLEDIAEEAGVSTMTVSNVINGKHARVSAATIERVQRIVAERGYVPSASARSLAAQSSRLIGLLAPVAQDDSLTISPHNVAMLGLIERELRAQGFHLLLRGIARPGEVSEALRSWNLDGAVLLGFLDEEIDRLESKAVGDVSLLAIDSHSDNRLTTGVRSDDYAGGRLAADHLLAHGHRTIVFAAPAFSDHGVVWRRFDGFRRALDDAVQNSANLLVETVSATTHAAGVELGRKLRAKHPSATAVFATADILAIGIQEGLGDDGVAVPDEFSVVGFDNMDIAAYVTPKLTTIAQDIPRKASLAIELLLAAIQRGERPTEPVVLDVHLVERESTGPPPKTRFPLRSR